MNDEVKNPFPGLRPFEFTDNHLFFGRDEQTTELTTRLRKNRFVAVVGTSGSGKSSLVRAGLLPELLSGTMAGAGSSWETAIMRPGGDPLTNLANSIIEADLYDPDEEDIASQVRATLTRSGLGLVEAMRQSDLPEGTNFLLVVDQFEEIFRFRRSDDATDEQAAFFVNLLLEASSQSNLPLYIIITMRSDFLGECSQFPRLADTVNEGEFLIPRLNRDQRKEAILGPVKVAGGGITDRLLLRLLNDIGDDPDQLPILQHALMRTWDLFQEQGGKGDLDLVHYDATGGMTEALSRHADEVYNEQPGEEHKRIAQKLFKSLTEKVDANRGIRRPLALGELHEICGGEESHLRDVVDSFRKTGCTFLMPAGERELTLKSIIDISHESLMRVWRSLRNWVDEEAQSAKIYRRLADTASLYKERKAGLYRDPDLQIAISWRDENQPNKTWADRYYPGFVSAMAFLDESQEESIREEREREEVRKKEVEQAKALANARARSVSIFKFASIGITILALVSVYNMLQARASRDTAEKAIFTQANRSEEAANSQANNNNSNYAAAWMTDALSLTKLNTEIYKKRLAALEDLILKSVKNLSHKKIDDNIDYITLKENMIIATGNKENHILDSNLNITEKQNYPREIKGKVSIAKSKNLLAIENGSGLIIYNINSNNIIFNLNLKEEFLDKSFKPIFSPNGGKFVFVTRGSGKNLNVINFSSGQLKKMNIDQNIYDYIFDDSSKLYCLKYSEKEDAYKLSIIDDTISNISINLKGVPSAIKYLNNKVIITFISNKKTDIYSVNTNNNKIDLLYSLNSVVRVFDLISSPMRLICLNDNNIINIVQFKESTDEGENLPLQKNIQINHSSNIKDIIVSPDFSYLATLDENDEINFWNSNTGSKEYNSIKNKYDIKNIIITDSAKQLYTLDSNNIIRKLELPVFNDKKSAYFQGIYEKINITFDNLNAYKNYKIKFPKLRIDESSAQERSNLRGNTDGFQLAEIELNDSEGNDKTDSNTKVTSSDPIYEWMKSGSPKGEEPEMIVDNKVSTKYYNFVNNENTSLTFHFNKHENITSINFISANDALLRSPISYELFGGNEENEFTLISKGAIINELYTEQKIRISNLLNKSQSLQKITSYLTGSQISKSGNIEPYDYLNNEIKDDLSKLAYNKYNSSKYFINKFYDTENINGVLHHFSNLEKFKETIKYEDNLGALERIAGLTYARANFYKKAISHYKAALDFNSDDYESKMDLAICYYAIQDLSKFNDLLNQLIQAELFEKNQIYGHMLRGIIENSDSNLSLDSIKRLKNYLYKMSNSDDFVNDSGDLNVNDYINQSISVEKSENNENQASRYIELNHSPFQFERGLTIEGWVKMGSKFGWIVNYGSEGWGPNMQDGFSILQLRDGRMRFEMSNSKKPEKVALDIDTPKEQWFHVAFTWNSNSKMLNSYVNGLEVTDTSYTYHNDYSSGFNFLGPLLIPTDRKILLANGILNNGNNFWDGSITELRIWDYALDITDLKNRHKTRIKNEIPGLIGYWQLNHEGGSKVSRMFSKSFGEFNNQSWLKSNNLPFDKRFYPDFSGNSITSNSSSSNVNWGFLQLYGHIKILEGKLSEGLRLLEISNTRNISATTNSPHTRYSNLNNGQLLRLISVHIKLGNTTKAKNLIGLVKSQNELSSLGMDRWRKSSQLFYEQLKSNF